MFGAVAPIIAGVGLHGIKVQQRVAAHQPLQLCRAEQVDGGPATQHHEPAGECFKLRHAAVVLWSQCRTAPFLETRDELEAREGTLPHDLVSRSVLLKGLQVKVCDGTAGP